MNRRKFIKSGAVLGYFIAFAGLSACNAQTSVISEKTVKGDDLPFDKIVKTDAEWKEFLTKEQYRITRQAGTERPYSSLMNDEKRKGIFACVCCDLPLFSSETKFESNTGWASFYQPIKPKNVGENTDKSFGMTRIEVVCNRCDAHLGHVFDDGPKPTGLRYCINGVAMKFNEA